MKKKVLASLSLAAAMVATTMPAMAATDVAGGHDSFETHYGKVTTAETCKEQTVSDDETASCEVYAEIGSTFTVTIPKKITLSGSTRSGSYTVSCSGDIAGNEYVSVVPDASFDMIQTGKTNVTASVTQETQSFRGNNYTGSVGTGEAKMEDGATGSISAAGLTAGAWKGTFNFTISLKQSGTTEEVSQASFTINGKSFQVDDSMTFSEWVSSDYNTDGYIDAGYGITTASRTQCVAYQDGSYYTPVTSDTTIDTSVNYVLVDNE